MDLVELAGKNILVTGLLPLDGQLGRPISSRRSIWQRGWIEQHGLKNTDRPPYQKLRGQLIPGAENRFPRTPQKLYTREP
jgi:hypothetical protein